MLILLLLPIATSQGSPSICDTVILHLPFGKEVQFSENGELSKYGPFLPTYPTHTNKYTPICIILNIYIYI